MATTKHSLADQALRILSGGDISKDSETTIREMMIAISQARDFIVRRELWNLMKMDDVDIPGEYITSFEDVKTLKDDKKNMFYSDLPAEYLDLPRNMGIYQISLMQDQYNAFVPVTASFLSMFRGLAAQSLEGRKSYFPERGRIYYPEMTEADSIKEVLIKEVVASADIDEDDLFPIPADKEYEVIQMAIQMYSTQKQIPNDQLNDNKE